MKFIVSQMAYFMAQHNNRRNLRFLRKLFFLIFLLLVLYSFLFHYIMAMEGKDLSIITGVYWTLTVMSTLGFGDITFSSDTGKIFSLFVLLSGIILFMFIMPFTFIRFIYIPWIEAQQSALTPRKLPEGTSGHTLLVGADDLAIGVADKLHNYGISYYLIASDKDRAFALKEQGYHVMLGEKELSETYRKAHVEQAAFVIALQDEFKNTNIASTVREVAPSVPMAATADHEVARDILHLAGCNHVFCFAQMLGHTMARRVFDIREKSNIIGRFESLCVAEIPVVAPLVGKSVKEANLRGRFGLTVAGIWQGSQYMPVTASTMIGSGVVLLLTGTADQLEQFDNAMKPQDQRKQAPVIILGGGRVGKGIAEELTLRGIDYRLVEKNPKVVDPNDPRHILGDASERSVLNGAGIATTSTVLVTTHNDDVNIYLTIFCRKLRPEIQIIGRVGLDRNITSLYTAGASLVMSQMSFAANTITNLIKPEQVFMLTEGLNVFRVKAPVDLVGKTLMESGIRERCECNVLAMAHSGIMTIPPDPKAPILEEDELILIGSVNDEAIFRQTYMVKGVTLIDIKLPPSSPRPPFI